MATIYQCNGCEKAFPEEELRRVGVSVATMPGMQSDDPGVLRTDATVVGELCLDCAQRALDFVGENGDEDEGVLPDKTPARLGAVA